MRCRLERDPVVITCASCRLLTLKAIKGLRDYPAATLRLEERERTGDAARAYRDGSPARNLSSACAEFLSRYVKLATLAARAKKS